MKQERGHRNINNPEYKKEIEGQRLCWIGYIVGRDEDNNTKKLKLFVED